MSTSIPAPSSQRMSSCRSRNISYSDLMKPDEDWRVLHDASERRKIQNRLAQRAYRRNMRERTKELEQLKKELAKFQGQEDRERAATASTPTAQHERQPSNHSSEPSAAVEDDEYLDRNITPDDASMIAQWADGLPAWTHGVEAHAPTHIEHNSFAYPSSDIRREPVTATSSNLHSKFAIHPSRHQLPTSSADPPSRSQPDIEPNMGLSYQMSNVDPSSSLYQGTVRSRAEVQQADRLSAPSFGETGAAPEGQWLPQLDGFMETGSLGWCSEPVDLRQADVWTEVCTPPPNAGGRYGPHFSPLWQEAVSGVSSPTWAAPTQPLGMQTPPGAAREDSANSGSDGAKQVYVSPGSAAGSPFSSASSRFSATTTTTKSNTQMGSRSPPLMSVPLSVSTRSSVPLGTQATPAMQDTPTLQRSSLLHLAVASGHPHILTMLLRQCDIPLDVRDEAGYTPLQRAVFAGRGDMVALLLEAGADPNAGRQTDNVNE